MGFRLLSLLLLLLLAPAAFLFVVPRQKLGAMGGFMRLPDIPAPTTPKSMAKLALESPLGVLVLDRSQSMQGNDPDFIQSLASEVFVFFFAHLIKEDTAPTSLDKIHIATLLYSSVKYKGLPTVGNFDVTALTWPGSTAGDKRWLHLAPTSAGADQAGMAVERRFEQIMGKKGHDLREGATPHDHAARATALLVGEYRKRFGPSAEAYVVFMTDAVDAGFEQAQRRIAQTVPNVHLAAAPLQSRSDADNMIPSFLRALQLDEKDVTTEATKNGFDMATFGNRPVPFLVSSRSKPKVVTDTGVTVPVHGRDGLFYGICNPNDSAFAKSRRLRVEAGWGLVKVRVFRRPWWELKMEPHYYDMLDEKGAPKAILAYTSNDKPADASPRSASVMTQSGQLLAEFPLAWDQNTAAFTGVLPGAEKFPTSESDFMLVCKQDRGAELRLPFTVMRAVRVRYLDRTTGKTSRTAAYMPFFPMSQKP
jgi:hypothetical protein